MAKYLEITYSALVTTRDYENERVEIRALLEDGEDLDNVIEDLKRDIYKHMNSKYDYYELQRQHGQMRTDVKKMKDSYDKMKATYQTAAEFMIAQGIKTDMADFPKPLLLPSAEEPEEAEFVNVDF